MKEQLILLETAKLAKEKRFDVPCSRYYEHSLTEQIDEEDGKSGPFGWKKGEINLQSDYFINDNDDIDYSGKNWYMCSAPTQSLLQKWLREIHNIHVELEIFNDSIFRVSVWKLNVTKHLRMDQLECNVEDNRIYEKALEKGLQEALKLIKS